MILFICTNISISKYIFLFSYKYNNSIEYLYYYDVTYNLVMIELIQLIKSEPLAMKVVIMQNLLNFFGQRYASTQYIEEANYCYYFIIYLYHKCYSFILFISIDKSIKVELIGIYLRMYVEQSIISCYFISFCFCSLTQSISITIIFISLFNLVYSIIYSTNIYFSEFFYL